MINLNKLFNFQIDYVDQNKPGKNIPIQFFHHFIVPNQENRYFLHIPIA